MKRRIITYVQIYLPPAKSWGKVMFLHVSVILFMGEEVVSQHALQVVSHHALQQVSRGGCIPAYLAGFQAHTQWGAGGIQPRGVLQAHTQWGLQAHTQWVLQAHTWGCIPACTEADPSPRQLLLWVVRILLECILVLSCGSWVGNFLHVLTKVKFMFEVYFIMMSMLCKHKLYA